MTGGDVVPSVKSWLLTGDFPAISTAARHAEALTSAGPSADANVGARRAGSPPTAIAPRRLDITT